MVDSKKIAQVISGILSPVSIAFMVTIIFSFLSTNTPMGYNPYLSITLGIIFLCIFPIFMILYYFQKGNIDIWVSDQKTRTPFYIIAIIGYVIGLVVFIGLNYKNMAVLSMGYLMVTSVVMAVNLFTKISSHAAGVAGPLTALYYVFGPLVLPLFILVPIVIWARVKLDAHTPFQLFAGIIISIIVTYSVFLLLF